MLFGKRRASNLCISDRFEFIPGSTRVTPFGSDSMRKRRIFSASKIPDLLGFGYNTRRNTLEEFYRKDDEVVPKKEASGILQQAMNHGKVFEAEAAYHFFQWCENTWIPLGNIDNQLTYTVDYTCRGIKFTIGATPDLMIWNPEENKLSLVEIKCPYGAYLRQSDMGESESALAYTEKFYVQCQIQMLILKIKEMFLFIYLPPVGCQSNSRMSTFHITEDRDYQTFLLSSIFQAYEELETQNPNLFNLFRNEGAHNKNMTQESMYKHSKFLIRE